MKISAAITLLQNDQPVVVRDKTFQPRGVHRVILETGETVYFVYSSSDLWLCLDPEGEEIIFFTELDDELEAEDELVVYGGEDYEFSYEGAAKMEDEEAGERYTFKEYESANGKIVWIMERVATSDMTYHAGVKLTEEDLQEA